MVGAAVSAVVQNSRASHTQPQRTITNGSGAAQRILSVRSGLLGNYEMISTAVLCLYCHHCVPVCRYGAIRNWH